MKITVEVKTKKRIEKLEKISDTHFRVETKEMPVEGRANERVAELLANYFKTPKTNIELVSGAKSKTKVFEIY